MAAGGLRVWAWRLMVAGFVCAMFIVVADGSPSSDRQPARLLQAPDQSTVPPPASTTSLPPTTTTRPPTTIAPTTSTPVDATTSSTAAPEVEVLPAVEESGGAEAIQAQPQLTG